MVKRWRHLLPALLPTALLALVVVGYGLLHSAEFARRLVAEGLRRAGPGTQVTAVTGTLAQGLDLTGVRFVWSGGEVTVEQVSARWQWARLLQGTFEVLDLHLVGVAVVLRAGPPQPSGVGAAEPSAWPDVSGWPLRLHVLVERLRCEGLVLREDGETQLELTVLSGALEWHDGTVDVRQFRADGPELSLAGTAQIGLAKPLLKLHLEADWHNFPAALQRWELAADLRGGPGPVGTFRLKVGSPSTVAARLAGRLTLAPGQALLDRLRLERPGHAGWIEGESRIDLTGNAPLLELVARCKELDLGDLVTIPTRLNGTVELSGDLRGYRGRFDLVNAAAGWRRLAVAGELRGDLDGLDLTALNGAWLRGTLRGAARLRWGVPSAYGARLQLRDLAPAVLAPALAGRLSSDLHLDWTPATIPLLQIGGQLLPSRLAGRELSGRYELQLAGDDLTIAALAVHGAGFALTGSGRLRDGVQLSLRVERLAELVPGASGILVAAGRLRYRQGRWSGTGEALGSDLRWRDLALARLQLGGFLDEAGRLQFAGTVVDFSRAAVKLTEVAVTAAGKVTAHRLQVKLAGPMGRLEGIAEGGYAAGRWTGRLLTLAGADSVGPWHMAEATSVAVGTERLVLAPVQLVGPAGEKVTIEGEWRFAGPAGSVQGRWHALDLARLTPLTEFPLQGRSTGRAVFALRAGRATTLQVEGEATGVSLELEGHSIVFSAQGSYRGNGSGQRGTLTLELASGGELYGDYRSPQPLWNGFAAEGEVQGGWRAFDLSLISPWLEGVQLTGTSAGEAWAKWQPRHPLQVEGHGRADGSVAWRGKTLPITALQVRSGLAEDRLVMEGELALPGGGDLQLRLRAAPPRTLAWPTSGSLELAVRNLPVETLPVELRPGLTLKGLLGGNVRGGWQEGGRLSLEGEMQLADGTLLWRGTNRVVTADIDELTLAGRWQGEALYASLAARLGESGAFTGQLRLPLPARLPLALEQTGPLTGDLQGVLVEEGLFAVLFPGSVKESAGRAELQLQLKGTLQQPLWDGEVALSGIGGYLPAAGIRLEEGRCRLRLAGEKLMVEELSLRSGKGQLAGEGWLEFSAFEPVAYAGRVKGEEVLLVNLPELRVVGSPELNVTGTRERLALEGKLVLPEVLVRNRKTAPPKRESSDVVLLAHAPTPSQPGEFAVAATVQVLLGSQVRVEVSGIDARLEGDVRLHATGWKPEQVTGTGRLTVASGSYSTYGVRLEIERGVLLFAGGAIDAPTLDVLALRKADEVKAGVRVGGTPRELSVTLHSEPAMPDTDILSYIVFGRPLGSDTGQLSLLTAAARALLARGDSAALQDTLQRRLGIDVIDVTTQEGTLESSVVTVGKYLTPELYLSIGHGIFSGSDQLQLRYDLSRRWQLESTMGEASGADLYYKIEFR